MAGKRFHALTTKADGTLRVLKVPVDVSMPVPANEQPAKTRKCEAVWDTGATGSVITQAVVDDLGLQPVGFTQVHTAGGTKTSPVYMVCMILSNGAVRINTRATLADLVDAGDVLLGMDVIGLGDFAVTNVNGKTTVSFRIPSLEEIDYVAQIKQGKQPPDPGGQPSRWERRHPGKSQPAKRKRRK